MRAPAALRLALGGALAGCCVAGCGFALMFPQQVLAFARALAAAAEQAQGPGAALLVAAQALTALSGVLPAALIGVAAGAVYGIGAGFSLCALGLMAGAWLAFAASRGFLREYAKRLVARQPLAAQFEAAIMREGWRFVCLLRLSPAMPFSATSFALGLTGIGLRDYMLGTLASLPALFGYVLMGALTEDGLSHWAEGVGALRAAGLAIGVIATALLTLRLGRLVAAPLRG